MSLDLEVPLPQPVTLGQLLRLTEDILHRLLALPDRPPLAVEALEAGQRSPVSLDISLQAGRSFVVWVQGYADEVFLGTIEMATCPPYIEAEEAGSYAYISVGGGGGGLPGAMTLAAGLAMALARMTQSLIRDETGYAWSVLPIQTPDALAQALQLQGPCSDFLRAAECVYRKLPISQYRPYPELTLDLSVPLPHPYTPDTRWVALTAERLQQVLGLLTRPALWLKTVPSVPSPGDAEASGRQQFLFGIEGMEEAVPMTVRAVPPPPPGRSRVSHTTWWAEILLGAQATPITFALAASAAIALAQVSKSVVMDRFHAWNAFPERSPEALARSLTLPTPSADLQSAATTFYRALPIGQYEARSQEESLHSS